MLNILVVDDTPRHLDALEKGASKVIRQFGGVVESADTVDMAKTKLAQKRFDVVVTDVRFEREKPPLDVRGGLDILQHAKTIDPNTIVIMVTDWPNVELALEAVRKGAFKWINRDENVNQTLSVPETIQEALNERSSRGMLTGELS